MKTKLRDNQLKLLEHLARFEVLDYASCLYMLDTEKTGDTVALSYVFRPLTKNKYAVKYNDGNVRILAKGKRLFPDVTPLVTVNGSATGMKRAAYVSRVAMYLAEQGVESFAQITDSDDWIFIPSACWRQIR
ncbi:MAG: hypothetical protein LBN99_06335, partial [Oscillospiraceae bacterium]|nr:hypothetical protein [Oscillospiraceae bacterium]